MLSLFESNDANVWEVVWTVNISNLYNIICTVNTQHTSKQDTIITIWLYLATCFGRDRQSSGHLSLVDLNMAGHGRNT
jgi:hypothetical protein